MPGAATLGRVRKVGESVVAFVVPMAVFAVILSVIGLISEVVGIAQQTPVQRGIDAHTVKVTGTYAGYDDGSKFHDPTYTLSYLYEDEPYSTPLRSLPGNHSFGDQFCVEIDAEQPTNGRVCGTLGGLADARSGLRTGLLFLGTALLVLLVIWRLGHARGFRRRRTTTTQVRGLGNRQRRKPARGSRARARRAGRR
ncbi:hypothetical protein Acsp02_77060 [Actinoplanes sp. NBRC 103695]|nr:hypothetical protein Acsp02_77060 [Actinoplanes sp. NBRC 103695]